MLHQALLVWLHVVVFRLKIICDSSLRLSELHSNALKCWGPGSTVYRVVKASGPPHILATALPVSPVKMDEDISQQ